MRKTIAVLFIVLLLAAPALARPLVVDATTVTTEVEQTLVTADNGTTMFVTVRFILVTVIGTMMRLAR